MRRIACLLPALLALAPAAAWSWAPETRGRMVEEATRLVPGSLRIALEGHREQLLRGALGPLVYEKDSRHQPPWSGGSLEQKIEEEAQALSRALSAETPFGEVAERFGALAHYISDARFAPGASAGNGAKRYAHFAAFCESRRERFPLVFYGHGDEDLARGDWRGFALKIMRRASADDRDLERIYNVAGDPPARSAFDDRSVPFAVCSLNYSRSITDIVRAWLAVWSQAGGDMGQLPYASPTGGHPYRRSP